MSDFQEARDKAAEKIGMALVEPGPNMEHHFRTWRECRAKWPTLFNALDDLLRAYNMHPPQESKGP